MCPIYKFKSVNSTNELAKDSKFVHGDIIWAENQTEGRGQKGNKWNSEEGKNLTFTLVLEPEVLPANQQFHLLEAVALAVVDLLESLKIEAKVKWTNDVYVGDRKICGILIDNEVMGANLSRSIIGIGLNINQKEFATWALNPISLTQILGKEFELEPLLKDLYEYLAERYNMLEKGDKELIHSQYLDKLYLKNQEHTYKLPDGGKLTGKIINVERNGELKIEDNDGSLHGFLFKEIIF